MYRYSCILVLVADLLVSLAQQLRPLCNSFDHSSCSILIYHSGFFSHCGGSIFFWLWVFLLGSCPFFFVLVCFLWFAFRDETQIWLGDLRVVCGCGAVVCVVTWMLHMYMTTESCTYFYFLDASLSVRTEP